MAKPTPISINEWLQELERLCSPAPGESFSRDDVQEALKVSKGHANARILIWHREGMIEYVGKFRVLPGVQHTNIRTLPFYRFTDLGKKLLGIKNASGKA
jgi:hypothetical protein